MTEEIKHKSECHSLPGKHGGLNRDYNCNCCLTERKRIAELEAQLQAKVAELESVPLPEEVEDMVKRLHDIKGHYEKPVRFAAANLLEQLSRDNARLRGRLERLGDESQLSDHSPAHPKLLSQLDRAIEYQARIEYAKASLKENDDGK